MVEKKSFVGFDEKFPYKILPGYPYELKKVKEEVGTDKIATSILFNVKCKESCFALKVFYIHKSNKKMLDEFKDEYKSIVDLYKDREDIAIPINQFDEEKEDLVCYEVLFASEPLPVSKQIKFDNVKEAFDLSKKLLSPLIFMESKGKYHLDIRPENYSFLKGGNVKLYDYDCTCTETKKKNLVQSIKPQGRSIPWTSRYYPPELFESDPKIDPKKFDVYCFGMTLFSLIVGKDETVKYDDIKNPKDGLIKHEACIKTINEEKFPEHFNPETTKFFKDLLIKMLDKNPLKRPSLDEIKKLLDQEYESYVKKQADLSMCIN